MKVAMPHVKAIEATLAEEAQAWCKLTAPDAYSVNLRPTARILTVTPQQDGVRVRAAMYF
jgi:hypothetical protein